MRIPLNRFIQKFPLFFDFQIKDSSFKGYIPVPDGYPKTLLTEKYKKFGVIDITIGDDLFIEYFGLTVNEGANRLLATEEEKDAFKGAGKQMLCLSLQLILFKFDNLSRETTVSLEAYGGRCTDQYIPETYKEKDVYELLEEAIKANPHSAYLLAKELKSRKIKILPGDDGARLLSLYKRHPSLFDENIIRVQACRIIENNKLIEYYENLGFHLEGYYEGVIMASMSGRVGEILCP